MKTAKMVPLNDYVSLRDEIESLHSQIAHLQQLLGRVEANSNIALDKGIFVGLNSNSRFVKVAEVIRIEAQSNYSSIYLDDGEVLFTSKTLKHWEEKFNAPQLIRVHQSYLINIKKIAKLDLSKSTVTLLDKSEVICSREGKKMIKQLS
jgi:two-component system, LytTR family, response regulator